jgi:hypothetical protein
VAPQHALHGLALESITASQRWREERPIGFIRASPRVSGQYLLILSGDVHLVPQGRADWDL